MPVQSSTIIDDLRSRKSYVPTVEVIEIFGVSRNTLCGWVRSRKISAIRIGKENKFDPATLAAWLEQRTI